MRFGIERLTEDAYTRLRGQRIGLFSNLSAVDRDLRTTYDLLWHADGVDLVALFGPEHGFAATAADGVAVASATDPRTGLPVHSLYGTGYRPTEAMLDGIDLLVADIQDIGARYYTFLWSLTHVLEACGEFGVPVLVLDRPNPLGGRVDGGPLDPALASLVGRCSIPVQHGMTLGELARLFNAQWNPTPADLDVIACEGWSPAQTWAAMSRAFVPPSPNMPHVVTAQHYPGACLIEGTTLSEGRGTPLPFEVTGAPGIDGGALAEALNAAGIDGVRFRSHRFQPSAGKHSGQACEGVQAHITDADAYRPLAAWLAVIASLRQQQPGSFDWLPTAYEGGFQHFDRLYGDASARARIDAGESPAALMAAWPAFHAEFAALAAPHLLYER